MSVSYSNRCGIGARIELDAYRKKVKVKTCKHEFDENTKFHPQTGTKLWEERDSLPEPLADWVENGSGELDGGYSYFLDQAGDQLFIVALELETSVDYGDDGWDGFDFEEEDDAVALPRIRKEIAEILKDLKVEPESVFFGLWSAMTAG